MTDYPLDMQLVVDPLNPDNVVANGSVFFYDPSDTAGTTPLAIKDPSGLPLPNPLTSNAYGFIQPTIVTIPRVKWKSGAFEGFFYSYDGLRNEAVAARGAAEAAQSAASESRGAAEAAASNAGAGANAAVAAAVAGATADATAAKVAAQAAANLVGAPADAAIEAAIKGAGTLTKAALSAFASQLTADATTTVAQLNAWLAAGSALGVKRLMGAASINAPIIIPSDTYLEATGATITLTVAGNMVQNPAVQALRNSSADAVVTAGSTTITSATAAFTAADVGRTLAVWFVSSSTRGVNAYAKIVTVNSATSVTVDTAPQFTESGGIASVYGRDKNIHIRGGKWQRTSLGGVGNAAHSLFFRRVDNSSVKDLRFYSQGGKYAVSYGDYTNVLVENHYTESSSDAMHFTGPGTNTVVRGVTGTSGDDTVPFTTTDYGSYNDCHGDFKNIHVSDVRASPNTRLILLACSASEYVDGHSINGVKVNDVERIGGGNTVYTEILANDPNSRIDNVTLDNVVGDVTLRHVLHGLVSIRNLRGKVTLSPDARHSDLVANLTNHVETLIIRDSAPGVGSPMLDFSNNKSSIGFLNINGGTWPRPGLNGKSIDRAVFENATITSGAFDSTTGCIIGDLVFRGCSASVTTAVPIGNLSGSGSIASLTYDGCKFTSSSTNAGDLLKITSPAVVNKFKIVGCESNGVRGALQHGGTTSIAVSLVNLVFNGCNRLLQGAGGIVATYANVDHAAGLNTPLFATGGSLTVSGTSFTTSTASAFDRSATETVRVIDPNLKGDISKLAKNNGDAAFNTNAALACGTGPAVSNGTSWKNIYSGTVY